MTTEAVIAFATPIAVIIAAILQQFNASKASRDRAVIAKTGESIHTLVNSAMGTQLRISAIALRRLSDMTKHAADEAAAELAEKLSNEHEQKQRKVDEKVGEPALK